MCHSVTQDWFSHFLDVCNRCSTVERKQGEREKESHTHTLSHTHAGMTCDKSTQLGLELVPIWVMVSATKAWTSRAAGHLEGIMLKLCSVRELLVIQVTGEVTPQSLTLWTVTPSQHPCLQAVSYWVSLLVTTHMTVMWPIDPHTV